MSMNREQKRAMQRMGALNDQGEPVRTPRAPQTTKPKEERTSFGQFLREVRSELRKVAWPTKQEVKRYSIIVLVTVVIFTAFVTGADYLFGQAVLKLYDR